MQILKRYPVAAEWILWLITRVFVVVSMLLNGSTIEDVRYYHRGIAGTEAGALQEYPAVGVWPLWFIERFNFGESTGFVVAFIIACVLIDAAFLALLHKHRRAAYFWIAFGAAMAFVLYLRLDIFQGVLVALAAWFMATRPRISAAILGVAAMMKLWPAILAAGLVDRFNKLATWVRIGIFAITCVALSVAVALFSGVDRLTSPFSYQQVRGLQIESLFATPFMVLSAVMPGTWTVDYASSKSFEVTGPGVTVAASLAGWAMLAVFILAFAWALWHFLRRPWTAQSTVAWMLLIVLLLIASNKVFSPQYLLWVGPLVAILLARDSANRSVRSVAKVLVVMAVLSTVVYPICYDMLTDAPTNLVMALVLTARNALLIAAIVLAARYVGYAVNPLPEGRARQPELPGQPS